MEYELAGSELGGSGDALVGQIGCPFLFVRLMPAFEDCDFCIVGVERVKHAVKSGRMGPFVGIIAEENTVRAAGVCAQEAKREISIQYGLSKEDHLVISGRSIDGKECFPSCLE